MTRKYWTKDELNALRHGFEFHVGLPWSDAVNLATEAGTVRRMQITPDQWARVAAIVGTRTGDQCAKRLQTERRMEQERRAAQSASTACPGTLADSAPDQMLELPLPQGRRVVFRDECEGLKPRMQVRFKDSPECLDVSPYLGQASGRIVLSFNGRGAA